MMRSTGVIVFIACLVLLPQQQDATPILLQTMFKYYGLQNLWSSFFGKSAIDKWNFLSFSAYQKCYFEQPTVYYDDPIQDDDYYNYYDLRLQEENEVKWNMTFWNDRKYELEQQAFYNRIKRHRKDGSEAEKYFDDGFRSLLKPIMSNITCMLLQLDMVDKNLKPRYDQIINFVKDLKLDYEVLKDEVIGGYKFCEKVSTCSIVDEYVTSLVPSFPAQTLSYFKCIKEVELSLIVKKQVFDEYYKFKPYINDDTPFWGQLNPTQRGIMEFFYSDSF